MNLLIYISGWFWGWAIVNHFIELDKVAYNNSALYVKIVLWTMTWIWICWRFIA